MAHRPPDQSLLGHSTDLRSVAVRTAMMAMVVSTGIRSAVLVVPMAVIGFGVVDPRDRDRRRDDDRRWDWNRRRDDDRRRIRGCRRWWRENRRDGRRGAGRGRWRRRARGRWRRAGPGSTDGPRRSGGCTAARHRAKYQQASCGRAGGDLRGRCMDRRRRDDGRLHVGARGARRRRRRRRAGGGTNRRLGVLLQSAPDTEREDGEQRHRRGDRPAPGVTSPPGLPDHAARGRGRCDRALRLSRLARRRGLSRSA